MNIEKQNLIDYIAKNKNTYTRYLQKSKPELFNLIKDYYGITIAEKSYNFVNDNEYVNYLVCKNCKIETKKFITFDKGYRKFCSNKCSSNDEDTKSKMVSGFHSNESKLKRKETLINRYGTDSLISINREKAIKSTQARFGVDYAFQSKEIRNLKNKKSMTSSEIPLSPVESINDFGQYKLKIDKLSEANLKTVLQTLFESYKEKIVPQKRFKTQFQTFIVDYYLETDSHKFVFEFDGPTHYNITKTQIRDKNLAIYCKDNNIELIRFPYFMQIDDGTINYFFTDEICKFYKLYDIIETIKTEYKSGFYDKSIILPCDWNSFGWSIFWKDYNLLPHIDRFSVMQEIYKSLTNKSDDYEIILGIDYKHTESKVLFIENFPC